MDDRTRFDAWLERNLKSELGPEPGTNPPAPAYARLASERPAVRFPVLSGIGAALASKAVTGFAMTAFAVGITGAATVETMSTGSPVPPVVEHELRSVAQDLGQSVAQAPFQPAPPVAQLPPPTQPITRIAEPAAQKVPAPQVSGEASQGPAAQGGPAKVQSTLTDPAQPTRSPGGGADSGASVSGQMEDAEPSPSPSPSASASPKQVAKPTPLPVRTPPRPRPVREQPAD